MASLADFVQNDKNDALNGNEESSMLDDINQFRAGFLYNVDRMSGTGFLCNVDRMSGTESSTLRLVRDVVSLFYKDQVLFYMRGENPAFRTLAYDETVDNNIVRLPYASTPFCFAWQQCTQKKRLSANAICFMAIWLLLEHFQQVRWYVSLAESTRTDEIEVEKAFLRSQFRCFAAQQRVAIALEHLMGLPINKASRKVVVLLASILSYKEYTPSFRQVQKDLLVLGMDAHIPDELVAVLKAMKAFDKMTTSALRPVPPKSNAVVRWQRAIRMQIKINRAARKKTAKNILESQEHKLVRLRCERAKAERQAAQKGRSMGIDKPSMRRGISTSPREPEGLREKAKRVAKKQGDLEAIAARSEERRREMQREIAAECERLRNLQIGVAILEEEA